MLKYYAENSNRGKQITSTWNKVMSDVSTPFSRKLFCSVQRYIPNNTFLNFTLNSLWIGVSHNWATLAWIRRDTACLTPPFICYTYFRLCVNQSWNSQCGKIWEIWLGCQSHRTSWLSWETIFACWFINKRMGGKVYGVWISSGKSVSFLPGIGKDEYRFNQLGLCIDSWSEKRWIFQLFQVFLACLFVETLKSSIF